MATTINLKDLERRAWRSAFQDGFWDIYLGMLLLAMAVSDWLDGVTKVAEDTTTAISVGIMLTGMAILWAGKRFVTLPRIGQVKFGPRRKAKLMAVRVALGVILLLGIVLIPVFPGVAALRGSKLDLTNLFPILWPVMTLTIGGLAAYLLDYDRVLVIAALFAISVPANEMLRFLAWQKWSYLAFGLPALIIIGMGLAILIQFLRQHPTLASAGAVSDDDR